jgi:hypothetical protein
MKLRAALWFTIGLWIAAAAMAHAQAPPSIPPTLPPDHTFARSIAFIRGHLLTGDELVKQQAWDAALPHFRFPIEEIYGVIREDLRVYKTPPFDGAIKTLVRTVGARNAKQYPKALEKVQEALAVADAELKTRQPNWPRFTLQVAIETLKAVPDEYQDAVVKDRIVRPIGYQTARGFMLQANRMVENVAGDLDAKNADALRDLRESFAELKRAFAPVMAPKRPPLDATAMLALISRIEVAAGKLM